MAIFMMTCFQDSMFKTIIIINKNLNMSRTEHISSNKITYKILNTIFWQWNQFSSVGNL